jgi:hypothetical protein
MRRDMLGSSSRRAKNREEIRREGVSISQSKSNSYPYFRGRMVISGIKIHKLNFTINHQLVFATRNNPLKKPTSIEFRTVKLLLKK